MESVSFTYKKIEIEMNEVNVTLMWRAGTSQKWFRDGSREKE